MRQIAESFAAKLGLPLIAWGVHEGKLLVHLLRHDRKVVEVPVMIK